MARAPVSKTGGCRFEVLPLLPIKSDTSPAGSQEQKRTHANLVPTWSQTLPAMFWSRSIQRNNGGVDRRPPDTFRGSDPVCAVEDAIAVLIASALLDEIDRGRSFASPQLSHIAAHNIRPVTAKRCDQAERHLFHTR